MASSLTLSSRARIPPFPVAVMALCLRDCRMATQSKPSFPIVGGGKLLDIAKRKAVPADILIKGDTIAEIGRPGLAAPAGATAIDATHRLIHPGLINAHTHGPGNLGKGMGDLWPL